MEITKFKIGNSLYVISRHKVVLEAICNKAKIPTSKIYWDQDWKNTLKVRGKDIEIINKIIEDYDL